MEVDVIIKEMRSLRDRLFTAAQQVEKALNTLKPGDILEANVKPNIVSAVKKLNGTGTTRGRRGVHNSYTKIVYGQRIKVISEYVEEFLQNRPGGRADIQEIKKALVSAGLLKRTSPSPSPYIQHSKKFHYDKPNRIYILRSHITQPIQHTH